MPCQLRIHHTLLTLHRWAGLITGLPILVLALTGALLVFEDAIDRFFNPALLTVAPRTGRVPIQRVLENVRAVFPGEAPTRITLALKPEHAIRVSFKSGLEAGVDPYSAQVLGIRDPDKSVAHVLLLLHEKFLAGRTGELIAGGLTLLTLLFVLSGLILWWPYQVLLIKRSRSWRRVNFDLHSVFGFYSAFFLLFVTVTGVLMIFPDSVYPLIRRLNPSPDPAPPHSTVVHGARPLTPDDAIRIADAALPEAATTRVDVPPPGKGVYLVGKKFPEEPRQYGRSRVSIDQYSGKVLQVASARTAELGTRILDLNHPIHTGEVFGAPTQAIAFLVCLMLAGQTVTGFLIWWKPGKLGIRAAQSNTAGDRQVAGLRRIGTDEINPPGISI